MIPTQACTHLPFSLYIIAKTTETTSETREEITTEEITQEETEPVEEVVVKKAQTAVQEGKKNTFVHFVDFFSAFKARFCFDFCFLLSINMICSGTQDAHSVIETTRTTIHVIEKEGPAIEEVGSYDFEEKTSFSFSTGIVEEFSDNEGFGERTKLSVSRGVSIVSVSEDERTLSRNSSMNDIKNEINLKYDNDDNYIIRRESSLKEIEEDALSLKSENLKDEKVVELNNGLDEIDPEIDALLKRVQKQTSVLQEIIEKEKSPAPGEEDNANAVDSLVNSSASELKTEEPGLVQEDSIPVVVDQKLELVKPETLNLVDISATENPQTAGELLPESSKSQGTHTHTLNIIHCKNHTPVANYIVKRKS